MNLFDLKKELEITKHTNTNNVVLNLAADEKVYTKYKDKLKDLLLSNKSMFIEAPTGSGKTFAILHTHLNDPNKKPFLFMVPTVVLRAEILKNPLYKNMVTGYKKYGIIVCPETMNKGNSLSLSSLEKEYPNLFNQGKPVVYFDEVHELAEYNYRKLDGVKALFNDKRFTLRFITATNILIPQIPLEMHLKITQPLQNNCSINIHRINTRDYKNKKTFHEDMVIDILKDINYDKTKQETLWVPVAGSKDKFLKPVGEAIKKTFEVTYDFYHSLGNCQENQDYLKKIQHMINVENRIPNVLVSTQFATSGFSLHNPGRFIIVTNFYSYGSRFSTSFSKLRQLIARPRKAESIELNIIVKANQETRYDKVEKAIKQYKRIVKALDNNEPLPQLKADKINDNNGLYGYLCASQTLQRELSQNICELDSIKLTFPEVELYKKQRVLNPVRCKCRASERITSFKEYKLKVESEYKRLLEEQNLHPDYIEEDIDLSSVTHRKVKLGIMHVNDIDSDLTLECIYYDLGIQEQRENDHDMLLMMKSFGLVRLNVNTHEYDEGFFRCLSHFIKRYPDLLRSNEYNCEVIEQIVNNSSTKGYELNAVIEQFLTIARRYGMTVTKTNSKKHRVYDFGTCRLILPRANTKKDEPFFPVGITARVEHIYNEDQRRRKSYLKPILSDADSDRYWFIKAWFSFSIKTDKKILTSNNPEGDNYSGRIHTPFANAGSYLHSLRFGKDSGYDLVRYDAKASHITSLYWLLDSMGIAYTKLSEYKDDAEKKLKKVPRLKMLNSRVGVGGVRGKKNTDDLCITEELKIEKSKFFIGLKKMVSTKQRLSSTSGFNDWDSFRRFTLGFVKTDENRHMLNAAFDMGSSEYSHEGKPHTYLGRLLQCMEQYTAKIVRGRAKEMSLFFAQIHDCCVLNLTGQNLTLEEYSNIFTNLPFNQLYVLEKEKPSNCLELFDLESNNVLTKCAINRFENLGDFQQIYENLLKKVKKAKVPKNVKKGPPQFVHRL